MYPIESTAAKTSNERDNLTCFITFSLCAMDVEVRKEGLFHRDDVAAVASCMPTEHVSPIKKSHSDPFLLPNERCSEVEPSNPPPSNREHNISQGDLL